MSASTLRQQLVCTGGKHPVRYVEVLTDEVAMPVGVGSVQQIIEAH